MIHDPLGDLVLYFAEVLVGGLAEVIFVVLDVLVVDLVE